MPYLLLVSFSRFFLLQHQQTLTKTLSFTPKRIPSEMKTRSKSAAAEDSITNKDKQPLAVISKQNTKKKKVQKQALRDDNFDPRKPKKPPTAFFFYLEDFRKAFQLENPKVKSMREIGKACGDKWKSLPFQEKVAYYDIATEKRAEFEKSMADYIKKKESGELSDESEEEYM